MTEKVFLPGDFGDEFMGPVVDGMIEWAALNKWVAQGEKAQVINEGFLCSSTQEFYDQLMTKYEKASEEE